MVAKKKLYEKVAFSEIVCSHYSGGNMLRQIKHKLLVLMLLALLGSLWSAGETIYEIRVEGSKNISPELVTSAMSLRVGDALNPEDVSRSIKNLYRMGVFEDVQIHGEPYRTGISLTVRIVENPVVSSVTYQGFKVIKKDRIDELITLRIGSY